MPSDGGTPHGDGSGGRDAVACPADLAAALGTPCDAEGQSCGGPCTNPCAFCSTVQCRAGRWTGVEAPPLPCDAGSPVDPAAVFIWQAPGGFAGTGPAVVVRGDGTVRVWADVPAFDPASTPTAVPVLTATVSSAQLSDLFARWSRASRTGLPHRGRGAECYAAGYVRACATCDAATMQYESVEQVLPELSDVFAWFDGALPTGPNAAHPAGYCAFD